MKLKVTADDLKGSLIMEPGWYPCECTEVAEKPANDGSQNWIPKFRVLGGSSSSGDDYSGIRLQMFLNEKAAWAAIPVVKAFTGVNISAGSELDLQALVGRKAEVFVKPTQNKEGKTYNTPSDFREIQ